MRAQLTRSYCRSIPADARLRGPAAPSPLPLFLLLRNRTGLALQAIRDDVEAAASLGVRVGRLKFVLFGNHLGQPLTYDQNLVQAMPRVACWK